MLIPGNAVGTATPVGIPVRYRSTRKTEGLSENSGAPCTEKSIPRKEGGLAIKVNVM